MTDVGGSANFKSINDRQQTRTTINSPTMHPEKSYARLFETALPLVNNSASITWATEDASTIVRFCLLLGRGDG